MPHLSPYELTVRTGASYRRLDLWVRRGWLHPIHRGGTGYNREWPEAEVEVARRMAAYIDAGLSPESAHHAARHDGELPGGRFHLVDNFPDMPAQRNETSDMEVS